MRILAIDDNDGVLHDYRRILAPIEVDEDLEAIESLLFGVVSPDASQKTSPSSNSDFRLDTASQGQEGLEMFVQALNSPDPYQLVFVDMRMPPGWDGLETMKRLWEVDDSVFIVLCTAYSDYSFETLRKELGGRANFLILRKPFQPEEILQIAASRASQSKVDLTVDLLTQVVTRAKLISIIESDSAKFPQLPKSLVLLDIDRFGSATRDFESADGDHVLVTLAQELTRATEALPKVKRSVVARVGPDEFAVYICESDLGVDSDREETSTAKQLVDGFPRTRVYPTDHHQRHIELSISVGWSQVNTLRASRLGTADSLLNEAEMAVKEAKRNGFGKCIRYHEELGETIVRKHRLEREISHALDYQELVLFFQPILNMQTGVVSGFEALLRWQREGKFVSSPDEFIPIAEATGQIVPIGNWVISEAYSASLRLDNAFPHSKLYVTVNVSNVQLDHPGFELMIRQKVQAHPDITSKIAIEVTESVLASQTAKQSLQSLKELGFRIYLDDFGSGFSSLANLANMPFDVVKLDRSFVSGILESENSRNMIRGVITLVHSLGKSVVAEGVEKEEELNLLNGIDCQFAQGYLISKPLPEAKVGPFLMSFDEDQDNMALAA